MPNLVNPNWFAAPPVSNAPYVASVSAPTYTNGGTSYPVALPPNYAAGDLLLSLLLTEATFATPGTISGWTNEDYTRSRGGNTSQYYSSITILSKVAGASESAPTITTSYNAVNGEAITLMLAVRDWGSVGNSSKINSQATNSSSVTLPSVTTANDNALVLYILAARRGIIITREYDEVFTRNTTPEPGAWIDSYSQPTAGASPTNQMTFSSTSLLRHSGITLAIEP